MRKCIVISLFVVVLVIASCAECPKRDICFWTMDPMGNLAPMCFEKGEFSKTEIEREYKLYNSYDELMEDFRMKLEELKGDPT
jgi:hypothetical protein